MGIEETSNSLERLKFNLTETTGKLTLLAGAFTAVKNALPIDDIRQMQVQYDNLGRSLVSNRREIDLMKRAVDDLSQTTKFYSKDTLVQMTTQLKASSQALRAFNKDAAQLTETFANTYKRDAPKYLDLFGRLTDRLPILVSRMNKASESLTTMTEIFRTAGPEGISAYLTAIGKMESETKSKVDSLDDVFNKFFTSLKNQSIEVGKTVSDSFLGIARGFGAENIGTGVFALGGLGALALASRQGNRIGLGPSLKEINDLPLGEQVGARRARFGRIAARRGLNALPGILLAAGLSGTDLVGDLNGSRLAQAGLGLAGGAIAGAELGGVPGAVAGVTIVGLTMAAQNQFGSAFKGLRGLSGQGQREAEQAQQELSSRLGFGGRAGAFLGDVRKSMFGRIYTDMITFGAAELGHGYFDKLANQSSGSQEALDVLNRDALRSRAEYKHRKAMLGLTNINGDVISRFAFGRQGINAPEGSIQEASLLAQSFRNEMQFLKSTKERGYVTVNGKREELTPNEKNELTLRIQDAMVQALTQGGRATQLAGIPTARTGAQLQFALGLGNRSAIGGAVGASSLAIEQNITELEKQRAGYASNTLEDQMERLKIDQQLLVLKKQLIDLSTTEQEFSRSITEIAKAQVQTTTRRKEAEGISFDKLQDRQRLEIMVDEQLIRQAKTIRDIATKRGDENRARSESLKISQLEADIEEKKKRLVTERLDLEQSRMSSRFQIMGLLGNIGPEEQARQIGEQVSLLRKREKEGRLSGRPLEELKLQIKVLEEQRSIIQQTEGRLRPIERENELLQERIGILTQLNAPVQMISQAQSQALDNATQQLTVLKQQREFIKERPHSAEQLHNINRRILQQEANIARIFDVQRRTFAEMFSEQMLNLPSGSFLAPNMVSGFGMLGTGFRTGASRTGRQFGTIQQQFAERFGPGMDERTPVEKLFGNLINEGIKIKEGTRIKLIDNKGNDIEAIIGSISGEAANL